MGHISFADVDAVNAEHGHRFTPELLERYQIVGQGLGTEMSLTNGRSLGPS
jgi:hypothetical protein